jgi:quercetin dioxygenase-like cupin family protein
MNAIIAVTSAILNASAISASADQIRITTSAERAPAKGPAEYFTGDVTVNPYYSAEQNPSSVGSLVEFPVGARTAWHTHPAGQTLIITSGTGWVQQAGQGKRIVKQGDVVWFPEGVKHWHGAIDDEAMSHIAITNMKNGKNVEWLDKVSDEQYSN